MQARRSFLVTTLAIYESKNPGVPEGVKTLKALKVLKTLKAPCAPLYFRIQYSVFRIQTNSETTRNSTRGAGG